MVRVAGEHLFPGVPTGRCCAAALMGRPDNAFKYTGKASTRAKYISDRAKDAHGLTYSQALQLQYRSRCCGRPAELKAGSAAAAFFR